MSETAEMSAVERLVELEAIYRLKARRDHAVDRKDWETYAALHSDDYEALSIRSDHADFPTILAEALDHVSSQGFDLAAVAQPLGTSTTQLVRLLDQEPRALAWVNRERRARNLRPLRG